jgi:hypothetical protein
MDSDEIKLTKICENALTLFVTEDIHETETFIFYSFGLQR